MTTIIIPDALADQLRILAEANGKSLTDMVKEALDRFLEEKEDAEEVSLALEEYRRNPGATCTLDDVLKEVGLYRENLV